MEIKTEKELIAEFFEKIKKREDVDREVVEILLKLFKSNKLTEENISNELEKIIKSGKK